MRTAPGLLAVIALLYGHQAALGQASFTPIPGLPGTNPSGSEALAISADGTTVVGDVFTTQWEAMTWSRPTGTLAHGVGHFDDVSQDGSIAVGDGPGLTARWSAPTGWQSIPSPAGAHAGGSGIPRDGRVSRDGAYYTGTALDATSNYRAVRWQLGSATSTFLPVPPSGGTGVSMYGGAVTNDGNTVMGTYEIGFEQTYRWQNSTGASERADSRMSRFGDMTPDANVVVGTTGLATDAGFIWSTAAGFVAIPNLAGYQGGFAKAVSDDGRVVVGQAGPATPTSGVYIWDPNNGTRSLQSLLVSRGLDLHGFTLTDATGISADGSVVCGQGINALGLNQAWIATVPAPGMISAAAIAVAGFGFRRRRR